MFLVVWPQELPEDDQHDHSGGDDQHRMFFEGGTFRASSNEHGFELPAYRAPSLTGDAAPLLWFQSNSELVGAYGHRFALSRANLVVVGAR